ncbi:WhiB family transcriptional regulator [Actinokineospora terrae]|uniref:Transcriptional regulator WhiB n=1 Tax=Actinokineospora terrae TaxID=155974 RepID=A0A1H9TLI2_9PSEU|nr:WhiB family transcriptional regulator [Actinokineospora terrae]SER97493.1 WhiB family transcriptional regulator, redox-sensing transcriptional regulator [Actinokineospora terrae]
MAEITRLPKPVSDEWAWQLNGSCRGADSMVFFHPDAERGPARHAREERAKAVCRACPVLAQCREHALAVQEPYGIWGAMGEGERRTLIAQRRRALRVS